MNDNKKNDVVTIIDACSCGNALAVRETPTGEVSLGVITSDGSMGGEPICLSPIDDHGLVNEVLPWDPSSSGSGRSRPAQVATRAYRSGWEGIWGAKKECTLTN